MKTEFKRLNYEQIDELKEKFKRESLTCGFMREPYYNERTNQIRGFCYIRENIGESKYCRRYLPFSLEGCKSYERWREIKMGTLNKDAFCEVEK